MKITKKDLISFEMNQGFEKLKDLKGVKLAYAISKNRNTIIREVEPVQEASKPSEAYQVYDKERLELCREYAKKDSNQNPIMKFTNGGQSFDIENKEEFGLKLKELREKHNDAIEENDKKQEEVTKLLDEEIELDLHPVAFNELPTDINPEQMSIIMSFLEEE